jgi:hypothetical protein
MKIKFMAMAVALLMMAGFSLSSTAGSITDTDGDSVPDAYDNCTTRANGPALGAYNQADTDGDGFGNNCDADYDQGGVVLGGDFSALLGGFGSANANLDLTGDGLILGDDFSYLLVSFGQVPGPSGLACADATLIVPPADACVATPL